jgi:hypothetical protein
MYKFGREKDHSGDVLLNLGLEFVPDEQVNQICKDFLTGAFG